jgi:formylglycine-generating enzyme required for sulfatase activity
MPTFGHHQTDHRLHQTGVGGLFALAGDPGKALKLLLPTPGVWPDPVLRNELDAFLLRAKTQRLAAKASPHWAPMHETGALPAPPPAPGDDAPPPDDPLDFPGKYRAAGAYAVLDRYDRSAQSLLDGRVHLTNDDLRRLLTAVMQGLVDLKKALGRAHGNLKAANVLLKNSADLAAATVHLADPAADGALSAKAADKDLADLAKLLYELVNLRPYAGGTIGRSAEWDRLGPNGEDWRALCNALLDPAAPAAARDLEQILPRVATWTAKPKQSKAPLLIAASVLFVLVVGGASLWFFTRPPKIDFDGPRWEKLCLSYHSWFGDFVDQFADDATKKKFAAGPYPPEVLKLLADAGKDLEKYAPKAIARQPSSADDLAAAPTDNAKTGYGPYYTQKGDELIDAVTAALTPDHWPLLKQLDKTAADFDGRGWKKPAAGIRGLIAAARPPALPPPSPDPRARANAVQKADVVASIDRTIQAAKAVADINARWAHIEDLLKQLPQTPVPLLQALPAFAEQFPRSEADPAQPATLADVTALADAFGKVETVLTGLVSDLKPAGGRDIVFAELAADPAAQVPPGPLTPESFTGLPAVARGYVKLAADPRAAVDWAKSLDDLQKEFIDKISEANPQDPNLPALVGRHAALAKAVADFAPDRISAIEKNRDRLDTLVANAKDDLSKLTRDGGEWVAPYIIDPAQYIAKMRARLTDSPLAKATPAVYAQWQKRHADVLTKVEAAPAELKKYRTYKAVDAKFAALEAAFAAFDQKIPAAVPGLADVTGSDWRHTVAAHVSATYREKALTDLMTATALPWADDLPQTNDQGYQSFERQRLAQFDALRADTLALLADGNTLQDRLTRLQLTPADAQGPTWRELFAKWFPDKHALLTDPVIAAATKPIADRAAAVLALDTVADYKALVAAAAAPAPEVALTAWRKLGAVPVAEDLPVLDDEDKAEATLTAAINTLAKSQALTPDRLAAFTAEIAAQRPVRWRRWAETLTSAPAIQAALDRRASFNVTLSPQADAPMLYNEALYALRKEFDKNLKEAELKPLAQSFLSTVNGYPDVVGRDKTIQDFLARLAKPLQQTEVESSSAGAGPKLAGWEQDTSPDRPDSRLFYFPTKANPRHVLEFVRLQVVEGGAQKTIFVCTTETSVGLFADVVNASGKFADLDNTGKPAAAAHWFKVPARAADDLWLDVGPRAWKIADKKFRLNDKWLFAPPQMGDNPLYPAGAEPAGPADNDPMQVISPWSAMYVARLLGCRLPTSDEWQAAYQKYETGPTLQKDVWNLRGDAGPGKPTWRAQQDYAARMAGNGMKFPDQGIFLTADLLFAGITAQDAKPWRADALAKLAPARVTPGPDAYKTSALWFRKVGTQPGAPPPGSGGMHDLVGNVAEYVFDGPNALAVIKDAAATPAAVDAAITAGKKNLFVIGGSALSPPDMPVAQKQVLDPTFPQTAIGYCDVGFRLAYTAPIDSVGDVLASAFRDPHYLPGPKAKVAAGPGG